MRACPPTCLAVLLAVAGPCPAQCLEGCVAIHSFVGESAGDEFGWKSNAVGDLDGDGVLDFVITAPSRDVGGGSTGTIYVYSGAGGQELWRADGPAVGGKLGTDAWAAGLINDDAVPDVIAGAPLAGAGRAIVFDGTDGSVIRPLLGEFAGDRFGFRVAGGGDADGDGRADYLVTAAWDLNMRGRAYLISGSVGVVGDLDGDGVTGINDLLILLSSWDPCADCDPGWECPANFSTTDCEVGITDFLILLANWTG